MRIELCEDNGTLSAEGKPTLVILVITRDDGKQIRVPYQANKKISDLYVDARNLAIKQDIATIESIVQDPAKDVQGLFTAIVKDVVDTKFANTIQREDIVTCVRQEKDIDGNVNEEIEVGKQYRVIEIVKKAGKVIYYEVLDDAKGDRIRIQILPSEVELFKKYVRTTPPRKEVFEITKTCDCGEIVSLSLNGETYEGVCEECRATHKEPRKGKNNVKSIS